MRGRAVDRILYAMTRSLLYNFLMVAYQKFEILHPLFLGTILTAAAPESRTLPSAQRCRAAATFPRMGVFHVPSQSAKSTLGWGMEGPIFAVKCFQTCDFSSLEYDGLALQARWAVNDLFQQFEEE